MADEDLTTLSRQAENSTYAAETDVDENIRPKPGPQVVQTLGKPAAGGGGGAAPAPSPPPASPPPSGT